MGREKREVWAKRIERWRDSGLSAREFGAEIGVNPDRLRYWKWHLAKSSERISSPETPVDDASMEFVEVMQRPTANERQTEPIEIVVSGGLSVRVPARFDAETLRRLLDVLRS